MSTGGLGGVGMAGDLSFEEFVGARSARLFTMALLLTGHRRAEAEDLLQDVLERAYRRWGRITSTGSPDAYVRQMMVNAAVDRWRLVRHRREEPLVADSANIEARDQVRDVADRDMVLRVLAQLPPRQRAVLVLRYFEDLTEAQTAAILGCTTGAVKSQASRALARLRQITRPAGSAGRPDPQALSLEDWRRSAREHG